VLVEAGGGVDDVVGAEVDDDAVGSAVVCAELPQAARVTVMREATAVRLIRLRRVARTDMPRTSVSVATGRAAAAWW
jgi:hypothetical protein